MSLATPSSVQKLKKALNDKAKESRRSSVERMVGHVDIIEGPA
jgi:hypothetical protein